ncbi:alpha/beta hydrolase [Brevibacterium aurantiacum]|uniref:Alpha/beta hydrolase n=1 Tax=Brevibacterium aurantiacum TaxID=273384 RepID=A0A556CBU5_BREAU|nr:alpha/beta hydrolase-fold protein [Brevibacterium aurantiacum]TSI14903.1 alpha/beta hydrolase [Brevibacterium aurantiacum]
MSGVLHGSLPDTEYFEITSKTGNSYGIWVTTPLNYGDSTERLPLIYVVDGNWSVGLTAPLNVAQADPYLSIAPYIQVSIGYAGDEAADWATLRNRDLVPPGEPVSDEMVSTLSSARDSGAMTQEQVDAYLSLLSDTHADVFLDFITDELHPVLQSRLNVSQAGHGLFGSSYGGLFALYAWLRGSTTFATFGAGSPGVISPESRVFDLVSDLQQRTKDSSGKKLHITLNEDEILGDIAIYRGLARSVLDLLERLHSKGWSQDVSRAILRETHVTGLQASFLSYLKSCHTR